MSRKSKASFVQRRAVVLLSGGLDSATTLYIAKDSGFNCSCLIFDYGQRHKTEISFAKRIARKAGCPWQVVKINFPWKGSALLDKQMKLPRATKSQSEIPSTYVPARNIIFLSHALSFAETLGAKALFIGAHSQDYSGYPDCRPEFFSAFEKVIKTGTKAGVENKNIRIIAPLLHKTKAQIIRWGNRLKVPWGLTWSCYKGGSVPCGKCDSCRYRAKGFLEAGSRDPLIK
jgi:7-cyano-7-deazaguanine synthase